MEESYHEDINIKWLTHGVCESNSSFNELIACGVINSKLHKKKDTQQVVTLTVTNQSVETIMMACVAKSLG
jgi:hypothetical protein